MKIEISEIIVKRLEEHLQETAFKDGNQLVEYILETYLNNKANKQESVDESPQVDEKIKGRLKALGYM